MSKGVEISPKMKTFKAYGNKCANPEKEDFIDHEISSRTTQACSWFSHVFSSASPYLFI